AEDGIRDPLVTGVQTCALPIFLEPIGHRASPISVRFELPRDWKIISALKETSDPMIFTAPDYDTLVDCPTEMGRFDLTQFQVERSEERRVGKEGGRVKASDELI